MSQNRRRGMQLPCVFDYRSAGNARRTADQRAFPNTPVAAKFLHIVTLKTTDRLMRQNYPIYLNCLACVVILSWTVFNFISFIKWNIFSQSEQISDYSKITAIMVGLYTGLYCINRFTLEKYNAKINTTSLLTISTLMFSSASFSQDITTKQSIIGFIFIAAGNAAILIILVYLIKLISKTSG